MIRKLQKDDEEKLLAYLDIKPSYSIYFVADVLKFGFDSTHFTVWGCEREDGDFDFVLGLFYDTLMLYAANDVFDAASAARFVKENGIGYHVLVARDAVFDRFGAFDIFSEVRRVYLCELTKEQFKPVQNGIPTAIARSEDAEEVYALRSTIEEFKGLDLNLAAMRSAIEQKRTVIVRENGRIASVAMCSAVTGRLATIGGVCTAHGSRGKGYATQAVSDLSAMLLNEGLTCSLSYNNPSAGAIYHRLGYAAVGQMVLAIK